MALRFVVRTRQVELTPSSSNLYGSLALALTVLVAGRLRNRAYYFASGSASQPPPNLAGPCDFGLSVSHLSPFYVVPPPTPRPCRIITLQARSS